MKQNYLQQLVEDGHIDVRMSIRADKLMNLLDTRTPRIAPGPDGMLGMTWENSEVHLNIEMFPDGRIEIFSEEL